jgi:hypothetical protein
MGATRQIIPLAGLAATMGIAAYMVVQMHGQAALTGDFSNASVAEVRDAQGQVVLRGDFAPTEEADDDVERRAVLAPPDGTSGTSGEAGVEIARNDASVQEVEFSVSGLTPGTTLTFTIDGVQVAQGTTDTRGHLEVELDVAMPRSAAPR